MRVQTCSERQDYARLRTDLFVSPTKIPADVSEFAAMHDCLFFSSQDRAGQAGKGRRSSTYS
jgi:hypothetical protein